MLTFLDAVNESLVRSSVVKGDTGKLTTTMGTASEIFEARSDIQHSVDLQIQMWREAIHEIFTMEIMQPLVSTATIVLADGEREYALPSDFERVAGKTNKERVLRGVTTGVFYHEYPGGYLSMIADQPQATQFTSKDAGRWAVSPANTATTMLRLEYETSTSTQRYNMAYERRIDISSTMATEVMPFSDTVSYALVPVVSEFYQRTKKNEFDRDVFRSSLSRAVRFGRHMPQGERYGKRRLG